MGNMNYSLILQEVLQEMEPEEEIIQTANAKLSLFLKEIEAVLQKRHIKAKLFVGGSFAKQTLIKKKQYDIDIFLKYDQSYRTQDISQITSELLAKKFKAKRIHGSRDYFQIQISKQIIFEIVPVLLIKKPEDAENVTDLSSLHVTYLKKKIKDKKIFDEIKLAKSFLEAQGCYGAESYIGGFSGYSIELLMIHYKSFLTFLKAITTTQERIIIDLEKAYPRKQNILLDINESKLQSPIILIDPTFKQRNVLAALTQETYDRLRNVAKIFLQRPKKEFFKKQSLEIKKWKEEAQQKMQEFIIVQLKTEKQAGDIAGSKLKKFFSHLTKEIQIWFELEKSAFTFNKKQNALCLYIIKGKKEITQEGPQETDKKNATAFKKKHKKHFVKKRRLYATEKQKKDVKGFLKEWEKHNQRKLKEMHIKTLKVSSSFSSSIDPMDFVFGFLEFFIYSL